MAFVITQRDKYIESTETYDTCDDLGIKSINKTTLVHHYIFKLVNYKYFIIEYESVLFNLG